MPSLKIVTATVRTILAAVAVSLYVLFVAPPAILWTMVSRNGRFIYAAGNVGIRLGFALAGLKLRIVGRENILRGRAAVYAANHSSNIDPPALYSALQPLYPKLRILYKAELRKVPLLVWVFDAGHFVPIERQSRGRSFAAVDLAVKGLVDGNSFMVFPEGTRSRTDQLLPFKAGGFVMAIRSQSPVVPVAISGGKHAMRKGSRLIWPTTITVKYLPAVPTTGLNDEDRDRLAGDVRARIDRDLSGEGIAAKPQ